MALKRNMKGKEKMKRTTIELYGDVEKEIIETRNSLARYFIAKAKKRIEALCQDGVKDIDDALLNDVLKAKDFWERLMREEV